MITYECTDGVLRVLGDGMIEPNSIAQYRASGIQDVRLYPPCQLPKGTFDAFRGMRVYVMPGFFSREPGPNEIRYFEGAASLTFVTDPTVLENPYQQQRSSFFSKPNPMFGKSMSDSANPMPTPQEPPKSTCSGSNNVSDGAGGGIVLLIVIIVVIYVLYRSRMG